MEVLKRYCSLPDYQRICCKTCSNVTITDLVPNPTSRSTPITSIWPRVTAPPLTSIQSSDFTNLQPTEAILTTTISASTINSWPATHPPATHPPAPTTPTHHSTLTSWSITEMTTTDPPTTTSAHVLSTIFPTTITTVSTTFPDVTTHPLPLPAPDTDWSTYPLEQGTTDSPTTSGSIPTTDIPTTTNAPMTDPAEITTQTDILPKFKPEKKTLSKETQKKVIPSKVNPKNKTPQKSPPKKPVLPKISPKKKTNPAPKWTPGSTTPKKSTPVKTTPKKTTPVKPAPKKTTPVKTTPKKPTPKKTTPLKNAPKKTTPSQTTPKITNLSKSSPKKTTPSNTTPKKTTSSHTTPKKTTPKKTTPVKTTLEKNAKPSPKKEIPPKNNPKKNIEPKSKVTKQTQTKTNVQKNPKSGPKSVLNSQTKVDLSRFKVKKTTPKNKTLKTLFYDTTTVAPYASNEPSRDDFSSTISSTVDVYGTTTSYHESEPKSALNSQAKVDLSRFKVKKTTPKNKTLKTLFYDTTTVAPYASNEPSRDDFSSTISSSVDVYGTTTSYPESEPKSVLNSQAKVNLSRFKVKKTTPKNKTLKTLFYDTTTVAPYASNEPSRDDFSSTISSTVDVYDSTTSYPKSEPKSVLNSQAKVNLSRFKVKKTTPKNKTLKTLFYDTTTVAPYASNEPSRDDFSSTISSTVDVYDSTTSYPKSEPKSVLNSQAKVNLSRFKVKKTNPKNKTLKTLFYYTTTIAPYASNEPSRDDFSSTISSSVDVYGTTTSLPFSESRINVTYISNDTAATDETALWYYDSTDAAATTPSTLDDPITPTTNINFEDATMPSGTMPYGDITVTGSGDLTVASGIIISGDDITVSYSNVGVVSDTMVLDDGLTMVIPTIDGEDMTELVSSPWLDLSEYIPVNIPFPTMMSDPAITSPPTTITPTSGKPVSIATTTTATSTETSQQRIEDSNSIDVLDNRIVNVDNDISQNNLIPKRRVNLRERTRNKRIQELLEEKRNFLLRMKRGHTVQ